MVFRKHALALFANSYLVFHSFHQFASLTHPTANLPDAIVYFLQKMTENQMVTLELEQLAPTICVSRSSEMDSLDFFPTH